MKAPGLVSVLQSTPIGDPLSDNLLATLWNTGGPQRVGDVLDQFTSSDLYERVRADMIAAGVLERTTRRRFWFFRRDGYQSAHEAYPVRARATVRDLVDDHRRTPDEPLANRALALAALVTGLRLDRHLFAESGSTRGEFHRWLHYLVTQQSGPEIRDVVAAVTGR